MTVSKVIRIVSIVLLSVLFLAAGVLKMFCADDKSEAVFRRGGYPQWLLFPLRIFELLAGTLLLTRFRTVAYVMIALLMLGSMVTHMHIKDAFYHLVSPLIIFLLSGIQLLMFLQARDQMMNE